METICVGFEERKEEVRRVAEEVMVVMMQIMIPFGIWKGTLQEKIRTIYLIYGLRMTSEK